MTASRHRFVPRYRGVAWTAVGVGGSLATVGAIAAVVAPIAAGVLGIAAGLAYLASPAWRLEVVVDDEQLAVVGRGGTRFAVPWSEVQQVFAAPDHHTCFVDGGGPERSLLVPGVGAPAPYDLRDRARLYDAILAHVPADRVLFVGSLEELTSRTKSPS